MHPVVLRQSLWSRLFMMQWPPTTPSGKRSSVPKAVSETLRAFDVDFAHCECKGTRHKSGVFVIAVRWKRKSCGKTRFQCMRCKTAWSMSEVALLSGRLVLDASHPQERKRRQEIHPNFNHVMAVNIKGSNSYRYAGEL